MRTLELSLKPQLLADYLSKQLNTFFPDNNLVRRSELEVCLSDVLDKIEICFSEINLPYYTTGNNSWFNYLHGDHYSAFLYIISNVLYKQGNENAAAKVFMLNKALYGIDAFYQIELPAHFLFVHPIGTILGRATYADFLVVYQGVTIGANAEGVYPEFGQNTILFSNSSVIGSCKIGSRFVLGSNSSIIDTIIDDNKVVVGSYPGHRIMENKKSIFKNYFS